MSNQLFKKMNEVSEKAALELKHEHVKLAAIDDVISANTRLQDLRKTVAVATQDAEKAFKEYQEELKFAKSQAKALDVSIKTGNKALARIEKDAKGLGVNPNSIKMYKDLKRNIGGAVEESKKTSKL